MKAAVIADIHENYNNLTLFLLQLREYKVDKIFFLGDFVNPGIALTLAEYEIPTFGIWGNNDGDRTSVMRVTLAS
jgi:predicted phosphodiesterase